MWDSNRKDSEESEGKQIEMQRMGGEYQQKESAKEKLLLDPFNE